MSISDSKLEQSLAKLLSRPGHENVRVELGRLLIDGLNADTTQVRFEQPVPEVAGRIDALLGSTVFEIKSDLRKEAADAQSQLKRYLTDREAQTNRTFVGIATDGAIYEVYLLREGEPNRVGVYEPNLDKPRELLRWLESVVALNDDLTPDVDTFRREVGRESIAYARALRDIEGFWEDVLVDDSASPDALLKRDLWNRLLRTAYGADIADDILFLQHTYLTLLAKAIATAAILEEIPEDPAALLDGTLFRQQGIYGAIESDFFDWILLHPRGGDLVSKIASHVARFQLREVDTDILKGLYESLIDPAQRHDLGEYYTPDWLAERVCEQAVPSPLDQRVIDPACGSGTFLFYAIRRLLAEAKSKGLSSPEAAELAVENVAGIEVHPVAVIFARVTFILALLPVIDGRPDNFSVPVFLGDALQWNTQSFMGAGDLEIIVPPMEGGDDDEGERTILRFPLNIARIPGVFDSLLGEMLRLSELDEKPKALDPALAAIESDADRQTLKTTYQSLRELQQSGRNHIWGYVARNLSRPIWLSGDARRADVIIGNPPWVAYNRMVASVQQTFRERMESADLWGGTTSVSGFDLSSYFFVRSLHLYGKAHADIAFVLPYAAMYKKPYRKFRSGRYRMAEGIEYFKITGGWALRSDVQPLFPRPSCVIFASRAQASSSSKPKILRFSGQLPKRDASRKEAEAALVETTEPWPTEDSNENGSEYRERFRQGAILVPRRFVLVNRTSGGKIAASKSAPSVEGRIGKLDKEPWSAVTPPKGQVEAQFLMPVLLGENIAPYRVINQLEAAIPWHQSYDGIMDSKAARNRGYTKLASWLDGIEKTFKIVRNKGQKTEREFVEQLDYISQLSSQFPLKKIRVVYAKSGALPAAAVIRGKQVIDHKLYWASAASEDEAHYLAAILNSETVRARAEQWQAEGMFGAQDFDKGAWNLPIPLFSAADPLHIDISQAAAEAEKMAAKVQKGSEGFQKFRKNVREKLTETQVAQRIEVLVDRLLEEAKKATD